ncbi:uncharacterized protein BX664DRAFT_362282 [Halteromyces radiatus]|uniref:uncharacterized protein n=1 Tax=Halteromyces radiatus TaxID=101107 RepID=UPI00221FDFBC|nr:uncharacterized protein BX664DRAFT_362282 [Halteromyces radiatus]KAI8078708.1 hypothetical protein BX664DRAFT_362282 [Halteromyces radiatus]
MAKANKFYIFLTLCSGMAIGSTIVNKVMKPEMVRISLLHTFKKEKEKKEIFYLMTLHIDPIDHSNPSTQETRINQT